MPVQSEEVGEDEEGERGGDMCSEAELEAAPPEERNEIPEPEAGEEGNGEDDHREHPGRIPEFFGKREGLEGRAFGGLKGEDEEDRAREQEGEGRAPRPPVETQGNEEEWEDPNVGGVFVAGRPPEAQGIIDVRREVPAEERVVEGARGNAIRVRQ